MMQRLFILQALCGLLLLSGNAAQAQGPKPLRMLALPAGIPATTAAAMRAQINKTTSLGALSAMQAKSAANAERLTAAVWLNDAAMGIPASSDSLMFIYNGTSGSGFDFDALVYDIEDAQSDYPGAPPQASYVNYDTLRTYDSATAHTYTTSGIRSYNAAAKVTRFFKLGNAIDYFNYDGAGRLSATLTLAYRASTQTYDSSTRHFYAYNAAGKLIRDSSERYNAIAGWMPEIVYAYALNAAGYPVLTSLLQPAGTTMASVFETNTSYTGANRAATYVFKYFDGTSMVNYYKDTFGYNGSTLAYHDIYNWDTATKSWNILSEERRHLNGAGLPDSVWQRAYYAPVWDTTIQKLSYDAGGNPVRRFTYNISLPTREERWYYTPFTPQSLSVGNTKLVGPLKLYPNPVSSSLHTGAAAGSSYRICDAIGKLAIAGTSEAADIIDVSALKSGYYTLTIQDARGMVSTGQFIKGQ